MTYQFKCSTDIRADIDLVFDLACDVEVHVESMADSHEAVIDGVTIGRLEAGDEVTWRAKHMGIWWQMTSEVTEFDRPHRFVDEQQSGPFASFHHVHVFDETADGVVMHDHVTFAAPFGPLGWIVERLGLGRYLRTLIARRAQVLKQIAETPGDTGSDR